MDAATREIGRRQKALLDQMRSLRVMRRGTLSAQHYPQCRARKQGSGASGPYYVWQGFQRGRHHSKRVSAEEAEQVEREIETRRQFEELCEEYVRLGEERATHESARPQRVVVITDGAEWIRNQAALHFPQATHIIDFYHARKHVAQLVKLLFANRPDHAKSYDKDWGDLLKEGQAGEIVLEARALLAQLRRSPDKEIENEIGYLDRNRDRIHYDQYCAKGLFIGSGVIEAGCRHVIGQRFKQSGMFWSETGANDILSLRCCILSRRFKDFWANRTQMRPATQAAA